MKLPGHHLSFGVCIFKARHAENEEWSGEANHSIIDEQDKMKKPLPEKHSKSLFHAWISARDTKGTGFSGHRNL